MVSIVSAVDHDAPDADAWFSALARQSLGARAEAIVCDPIGNDVYRGGFERLGSRGGDETPVRFTRVSPGGRAAGLNAALAMARGRIIVFLANDFQPGLDLAERHLDFHERHPGPESVGIGDAFIPEELVRGPFTHWLEQTGRLFGIPFVADHTQVPECYFYIGNSSVKRALLDRVGPFDEDFPKQAWDDYELGVRLWEAGMRAGYVDGATAIHMHPLKLHERCRTMREAGQALRIFERKRPDRPHAMRLIADTPPQRWRRAWLASLSRHVVTRRERDRFDYYEQRLNAAFAAGYRRECAGEGESLTARRHPDPSATRA